MINPTMESVRFISPQITGQKDVDRLETLLGALDGVRNVSTDPSDHSVCVTYNVDVLDRNGIVSALQSEGYKIESSETVPTPNDAAPSLTL